MRLRNIKIRTRLLSQSAVIFFLFILAMGIYNYALYKSDSTSQEVLKVEHNVRDRAIDIALIVQAGRKEDTNFRLHLNKDYAQKVFADVRKVITEAKAIQDFFTARGEDGGAVARRIAVHTAAYGDIFRKIVRAYELKGLTPDSGLRGKFRAAAHKLFNRGTMEHAVGDLLAGINNLWVSQRQLNRHDAGSIKKINLALARFRFLLASHQFYSRAGNDVSYAFDAYGRDLRLYLGGTRTGKKDMENDLDRMTAVLTPLFVPEAHTLVLQIRRNEKNYLIRGGKQYVALTHQAITNLLNAFRESGVAAKHLLNIRDVLTIYKDNFDALVAEDGKIAGLDEQLAGEYQAAQQDIAELSAQGRRQIAIAQRRSADLSRSLSRLSIAICLVAIVIGIFLSLLITNSITRPLGAFMESVMRMRDGDYAVRVACDSNDEIGRLGGMFNEMAAIIARNTWQADGRNLLADELRGDKELKEICRDVLAVLARHVQAQVGTLYTTRSDGRLTLVASYSFSQPENLPAVIEPGSGLVGEAARTREFIVINEVPADYIRLESSLGHTQPKCIIAIPLIWQNKALGVMELAFLQELPETGLQLLQDAAESIAIAIHSSRQRDKTQTLLEESQHQSEELQAQQEELQVANEELEEKNGILEQNEERLNVQQEELQAANEELEEKSEAVRRQKEVVQKKNEALEAARLETEQKAQELAASSQYKSEFLANMSHELRSPLNSLLLLARNLGRNRDGNLTNGQLKSIDIIQNSGQDLLNLINDILDLSKIEAGRMDIAADTVGIRGFGDWLTNNFQHIAADKGIEFKVEIEPDTPMTIVTDRQHLEQIIRNLLTNAIKFTMEGGVTVRFNRPQEGLRSPTPAVAIMVIDSGIGIPAAKQELIFDAFKQVDGSTSRKYGGTGLGLSIVRQLTALLGGEVKVHSVFGKGSEFTILLPVNRPESPADVIPAVVAAAAVAAPPVSVLAPEAGVPTAVMDDDRDKLAADDKVLLIIEDDRNFAAILVQQGREQGFKCLVAVGGMDGLRLAKHYKPGAIILDIRLPDIDGWQVLESLKANPSLRHIPIHMMSAEERSVDAMRKGAIGFLSKPVSGEDLQAAFVRLENALLGRVRNLLVIEDDPVSREHIADLIGGRDVHLTMTDNGGEALRLLARQKFDCMILDIGLPDMSGFEFLGQLKEQGQEIPPVIIHTGRTLTREEEEELRQYTGTVIVKGVKSEERLLDETALFLHRLMSDLPAEKRLMIASLYDQDTMFKDKRILVVDDDMRNAFALSQILEERGMRISIADDGGKALEVLAQDKKIDLILMDIMMPGMDGYEAMRRIRRDEKLTGIPIIALTAKAMAEDKARCMEAGASDYLAKPVEEGRLLSMMRVWLYC